MKVFLVVEDDEDIHAVIWLQFRLDPAFTVDGQAADVEGALAAAAASKPDLIVLDHRLEGEVTGLEAAPLLKRVLPAAEIILFSAREELRISAAEEPAVDAFVVKTDITRLVALSRRILGLTSPNEQASA